MSTPSPQPKRRPDGVAKDAAVRAAVDTPEAREEVAAFRRITGKRPLDHPGMVNLTAIYRSNADKRTRADRERVYTAIAQAETRHSAWCRERNLELQYILRPGEHGAIDTILEQLAERRPADEPGPVAPDDDDGLPPEDAAGPELWARVCQKLREHIPAHSFATWFAPMRSFCIDGAGNLVLGHPFPDRALMQMRHTHWSTVVAMLARCGHRGPVRFVRLPS